MAGTTGLKPCSTYRQGRLGPHVENDTRVRSTAMTDSGVGQHALFSVDERTSGQEPGQVCRAAASRFSARQRQGNLRVIVPRICRLSKPADYCHSNKYPLWVSAIGENERSLRLGIKGSKPLKSIRRVYQKFLQDRFRNSQVIEG